MPFGLVFGAVVFTVVGLWVGIEMIVTRPLPGKLAGACLVVMAVSLSLGLLKRQAAARWVGVVAAVIFTLLGLSNVTFRGAVLDHVLFLAAAATLVLLVVPATGSVRRGMPEPQEGVKRPGNVLGWTAAGALILSLVFIGIGWASQIASISSTGPVAAGVQPEWLGFATGLQKAKAEGKPMFVDFYAEWCGPCRMMDRTTFRDEEVARRLDEIIPVRIDSEDAVRRDGPSGSELADRYGVTGYPTVMLLDSDGKEIARQNGYMSARALLRWLDRRLPGA
jgi:thiol:disulfide interchange protein